MRDTFQTAEDNRQALGITQAVDLLVNHGSELVTQGAVRLLHSDLLGPRPLSRVDALETAA
jgi:hypothetical protein